jgi:quinol monooxygenase YgiN
MIVIAGTVHVRADRRAEAVRVALEMARATAGEPGCVAYRFSSALDDPDTFLLFEEWESEAALTLHFASDHMRAFQAAMPSLVAGGLEIWRYDGGSKQRMM